ncbi:hypothetical protein [Asaia sp. HN010]|uniref:hypothetical protein n=1 Tax=Asaia sp. HN010 TaxID=3081233 RepID=UPI0030181704
MTASFTPFPRRLPRAVDENMPSVAESPAPETTTAGETPLSRRLHDFSAVVTPPATLPDLDDISSDIHEEEIALPTVSLLQSELDALCRDAFEAGRSEGCMTTTAQLESDFASRLTEIHIAFEKATASRQQAAREAGQVFVQTVLDLLVTLTRLPAEALRGLEHDLLQDAADLIGLCDDDVIVQCLPSDEVRLRAALGKDSNIRFEPCATAGASTIKILSGTRTILIDPEEWRQSAIARIMTSVGAAIDREIDVSRTTDRQ